MTSGTLNDFAGQANSLQKMYESSSYWVDLNKCEYVLVDMQLSC